MPLITLTCSDKWYLADTIMGYVPRPQLPTSEQLEVAEFARALPGLIIEQADRLGLEAGTPQEAVLVDINKFHCMAVNAPDLQIYMQVTEGNLFVTERISFRDIMLVLIQSWFSMRDIPPPKWSLDLFFGPGHGAYTNEAGKIVQSW